MAREDTIGTFSQIAPSRMAHSPYASAYANLAENVGDEWVDSRKLRDVMEVARFMSQEDRAKKEEKRQAFYEDLRNRAETRAQERADRYAARQDYKEQLQDQADQLISRIDMIDPMHKNAKGALEDIRTSQNFGRLLASRDTRQAVLEALKNKAKEHEDIVGSFMQEGESKYGFKPSMDQIAVGEDGTFDTAKFYSETLPSLAQQMQQKAQKAYEMAPVPEGKAKYAEYDVYGRPTAKFVKAQESQATPEQIAQAEQLVSQAPSGTAISVDLPGGVKVSTRQEGLFGGLSVKDGVVTQPKQAAPSATPTPLPSLTPQATPIVPKASKQLTKETLRSLADELGPNASKESLMDLAKQRGYTF
jgi:hypothetical protein